MRFSIVVSLLAAAIIAPSHCTVNKKIVPDVTNKTLVLSIAELAANAYHYPESRNTSVWRNTTGIWNYMYSYGWEIDGLRGHIFNHVEEDIIIMSIKGTSLNSAKDKESANLICSCNCCHSNCTNECDRDKLLESLPHMYLSLLLLAYYDIEQEYPGHQIWFTGHSMGSVIASLAGIRTCNPVVGFSAPGEQLFADRIGLKHECDGDNIPSIYHFGYYRDPIYVGNCGWLCNLAGYRMDSKCHHGYECTYSNTDDDESEPPGEPHGFNENNDELLPLGSGMIYYHTINFLIDKIIKPFEKVPLCYAEFNCTEKCISKDFQI